ncbi:hypothetical protein [Avibacterium paragallinarum]
MIITISKRNNEEKQNGLHQPTNEKRNYGKREKSVTARLESKWQSMQQRALSLTVKIAGEDANVWNEWKAKIANAKSSNALFEARQAKPFTDVIEALRKAMESLNSGEIDGSRDFCNKRYFTEMNIITA